MCKAYIQTHMLLEYPNLNVCINKVGGVSTVYPATILNPFNLFREPTWLSSFSIVPHHDDTVDLQGWPDLDFGLTGDFSTRVRYLSAMACLSIILPTVEGTLNALANDLHDMPFSYIVK